MKKFLISIDTEGDNFWEWTYGDKITTENSHYVPRFQNLCEKYGFKPTYLTNYEMACDNSFVSFAKKKLTTGSCEIGMHMHAWNSPPIYELQNRMDIKPGDCSFLTEYPEKIIGQKVDYLTDFIEHRFGERPIVFRSGRWAMNNICFKALDKAGYIADCSVTPGMDMSMSRGFTENSFGTDYSKSPRNPYYIPNTSLLEIPMTVRENHCVKKDGNNSLKHRLRNVYKAMKGRGTVWLRPNRKNLRDLLYLTNVVKKEKHTDYLMFMLHTSEMMPGGSPTFRNDEDIEKLYEDLEVLFSAIYKDFEGCTISEYARQKRGSKLLK